VDIFKESLMTRETAAAIIGTSDPGEARIRRSKLLYVVHPDRHPNREEAHKLSVLINQAADIIISGRGERDERSRTQNAIEIKQYKRRAERAELRLREARTEIDRLNVRVRSLEGRISEAQRTLNGADEYSDVTGRRRREPYDGRRYRAPFDPEFWRY